MRIGPSLMALRLVGGIGGLWLHVRLAWRLFRDARVPLWNKVIIPVTFFYIVWPLDLVVDFLPFLGQVDDLTATVLALLLFVRSCPRSIVAEHRARLQGHWQQGGSRPTADEASVIEGQYHVVEDDERR